MLPGGKIHSSEDMGSHDGTRLKLIVASIEMKDLAHWHLPAKYLQMVKSTPDVRP